ncbi:MAG: hypothetical protein V2A61_05165 [Calditrichota bacterium]
MRKLFTADSAFLFVVLTVCLISPLIAGAGWGLIQPTQGEKISLKVNNKNLSYWELGTKTPVTVKVTGPTRIKLYTRATLPENRKEGLYGIVAHRDGKNRSYIGRATDEQNNVSNSKKTKQKIGAARAIYFKVPAGDHEYTFSLPKEAKNSVYIRIYSESQKAPKASYIAYLPQKFPEEVRIYVKETEYIYYRSVKDKPVELEIIGPTRLRGIARLEFDHSMRGAKTFRVQAREGDKVLFTKPFTTDVSGAASYNKPNDKVIGKGENFYITVPEGKHKIVVDTPDAGLSVLFRFYIPQKDLGNENKAGKTKA